MPGTDEFYMRGAFSLARASLGQTWPNPSVGAVVVDPGNPQRIIARGRTMPGGRPHAERVALERADKKAMGCTLYVTLEPCAHEGETPPCTDAIIKAGITRVVCSAGDPDERVAGKGFAALRSAGIEVTEHVLAGEGKLLSLGHALRVTAKRPMVQLKLAVGSDGRIPQGDGSPVWATGEEARAHGHLLRARSDAILVGRGTVDADDPALTCRLPGMDARSPVRVILDSRLGMSGGAKLINSADQAALWIYCTHETSDTAEALLEQRGARVIKCTDAQAGHPDPGEVLADLATQGITRVLVEGGPRIWESFWNAGLVEEIFVYRGSEPVGEKGLLPLVSQGLEAIEESSSFPLVETRTLGNDSLTIHRRSNM